MTLETRIELEYTVTLTVRYCRALYCDLFGEVSVYRPTETLSETVC